MISTVARKRATLDFIVVGAGAVGCVVAARLAAAHGAGFTHFPTIMIAERLSDTLEPV